MTVLSGAVDYWCNAFTPDRRPAWTAAIESQGLSIKVERPGDEFCTLDDMLSRMDETGFATLVLVACDVDPDHREDFTDVAVRPHELAEFATAAPGRIMGTWSIDPTRGMAGVERAAEMLAQPWCVGLHIHTHSWDRGFDHADYYPYYALAAAHDAPVVMQAGASGGRFPSECGRPMGIDRPAIYFPTVRFVLSHTGWPWTSEAIAMALKFSNVYLGTATWPPRRWDDELRRFLTGAGRTSCLFGSGFPTTGHRQAARQLGEADLDSGIIADLTSNNARAVFGRLPRTQEAP